MKKRRFTTMSTVSNLPENTRPGAMRLVSLALKAARPGSFWRVAPESTYRRSYCVAEDRMLDYFGRDTLLDDLTLTTSRAGATISSSSQQRAAALWRQRYTGPQPRLRFGGTRL